MQGTPAQSEAVDRWRRHRRRCVRQWWQSMVVSLAAMGLFVVNVHGGDGMLLAGLIVIAMLGLRRAWKTDRQILACDDEIRGRPPLHPGANN